MVRHSRRFAELFAGIGAGSLALERAGWHCAWHAEIAPFPRRVLAWHWPQVPVYGDVRGLNGQLLVDQHGAIALLAGGSPCQDLSVAGHRAGLSGARSGLFYEQMRLWDETQAELCLWENVPGALSSHRGKDFARVLSAFVGGRITMPRLERRARRLKWRRAGVVRGPRGVAAWRVLDAQYFGVPQRRRRVFVLGSRTGRVDPAEVLSLADSVRRDPAQSRRARSEAARSARTGVAGGDQSELIIRESPDGQTAFSSLPLRPVDAHPDATRVDRSDAADPTPARSVPQTDGAPPLREAIASLGEAISDQTLQLDVAPRETSETGPARGRDHSLPVDAESSAFGTLPFEARQITGRENQCRPEVGDPCRPLAASANPPDVVCVTGARTHALRSEGADASEDGTGRGTPIIARAVTCHMALGFDPWTDGYAMHRDVPRRLTPLECERLMGLPDGWTAIPGASDSARYRACGNAEVTNVVEWIGLRLGEAVDRAA